MDQYQTIDQLVSWLRDTLVAQELKTRCDHTTDGRETLGLYLGEKRKSSGRSGQIAQVDILVCNEDKRTVELIIEVQPNPNPKALVSQILPVLLADNYTPSYSYGPPYAIRDTVVIVVTETSGKDGSQKAEQLGAIRSAICDKFDLPSFGVRNIYICSGHDQDSAVAACKAAIESEIGHFQMNKASIVVANSCEKGNK